MKPFSEMGDAELAAALRSLRPEPSPAFAAELDQRVAAGFPRRSRRRARNPLARFAGWLRDGSRWRLLIPAGGVAIAAIAVATILVATKHSGFESHGSLSMSDSTPLETSEPSHATGEGRTNAGQPAGHRPPAQQPRNEGSAATVYGTEMSTSGAASGGGVESSLEAESAQRASAAGDAAAGSAHRDVERGADIVIGTKPGEVGEASSKVFEAVHRYDGVVLNSSTQDGSGTQAEASFELLIPSGKVGDAMAAFSQIGEVVSRHETTNDITAPTVGARERLQDSEARIEGLLAQLSEATTESEREVVEAELDAERHHAAHLKSKLSDLNRRASLSRVLMRIVGGKGALSPGGTSGDDGFGIGRALDDAGHVLSVAAGVTIVGLAVLAPLMVLALLAGLAGRAWTRRAREHALN